MEHERMERERDLVLAPNEYAYISDQTKGQILIYAGPHKTSLSATDVPVIFNDEQKRFKRCSDLAESIRTLNIAPEGWYIVLKNPSKDDAIAHPPRGGSPTNIPQLDIGRKVNIPGPVSFALWPGQMAKVIQGHRLKSNQFLLVRVFDDKAAQQWLDGSASTETIREKTPEEGAAAPAKKKAGGTGLRKKIAEETPQLAIGQLLIIKGTDVAFFIPPTGLEVMPDEDGNFVREAVSLERLEYCLLLDQDGNKRYVQGPAVVFPRPTEKFVTHSDESFKFRAIELNPNSGIYIKVIQDYDGEDCENPDSDEERRFKQGEELFITGEQQRIYFPREEHAIVKYSGEQIHFGTAMPKGEGRYVLDRDKGTIEIVKGPQIFLPDPRNQVIVRRVLTPEVCQLMYPGNSEALQHNSYLSEKIAEQKNLERFSDETDGVKMGHRGMVARRGGRTKSAGGSEVMYAASEFLSADAAPAAAGVFGDQLERRSEYTKPRTITLNNKYDGVVTVSPWTGYAIMVVNKAGERKVVEGPATCMLEYDEELQPLVLSAGRPKGTAKPKKTVYLQVHNNRVSDIVSVETNDFTNVDITLSYRVRFTGSDKEKWFAVANYTKLLSDHMRSKIRRSAMTHNIEEFYRSAVDIIRDVVLGEQDEDGQRALTPFEENGMQIYDVEVLKVDLVDPQIAALLNDAQKESITQVVQLARAKRNLQTIKQTEEFRREEKDAQDQTRQHEVALAQTGIKDDLALELDRCKAAETKRGAEINIETENAKLNELQLAIQKARHDQEIGNKRDEVALSRDRLMAEASAMAEKMKGVTPQLVAALQSFGDKVTLQALASSLSPFGMLDMMRGRSVIGSFKSMLAGSTLAESLPENTTPDGGNGGRPQQQPRR